MAAPGMTGGCSTLSGRSGRLASRHSGPMTARRFPTAEDGPVWWEVWLPVRKDRHATTGVFRERAGVQGMRLATGELWFPERTVLLARASVAQMRASIVTLNSIAELRQAKETAEFFDSLPLDVQARRLDDLVARTRYASGAEDVPHVCLLDTGVNRGHGLLAPALAAADLHAVEPGWGTDDDHGHGTGMAGLALGGNLAELLSRSGPVEFGHRLESVKTAPPRRCDRFRSRAPRIPDNRGGGTARGVGADSPAGPVHGHHGAGQPGSGASVSMVVSP